MVAKNSEKKSEDVVDMTAKKCQKELEEVEEAIADGLEVAESSQEDLDQKRGEKLRREEMIEE